MLNWYANTFRISEKNITKAGLRRTKILTWLTLMIVPLEITSGLWTDEAITGWLGTVIVVVALIGFVALIALLLTPLVHRFWARDKYLDEWEIEVKRKAMSNGYKVLFGALAFGLIYSFMLVDFSPGGENTISFGRIDSFAFGLLILALGVQTLTQLSLIKPIDADEVETRESAKSPIFARIAVVVGLFMLFFGPLIVSSYVQGSSAGEIEQTEVMNEGE